MNIYNQVTMSLEQSSLLQLCHHEVNLLLLLLLRDPHP